MSDSIWAGLRDSTEGLVQGEEPWYGFLLAGAVGLLVGGLGDLTTWIDGTYLKEDGALLAFSIAGGYFAEGVVYRLYSYSRGGEPEEFPTRITVLGALLLVVTTIYGFNPDLGVGRPLTALVAFLWLLAVLYVWFSQGESGVATATFVLVGSWLVLTGFALSVYGVLSRFVDRFGSDVTGAIVSICVFLSLLLAIYVVGMYETHRN